MSETRRLLPALAVSPSFFPHAIPALASIQHAARVFHLHRPPPCIPSANDSPTAAAPRCPSAWPPPHTPTRDKTQPRRCTSPPEIPPDGAFSNTPFDKKCPHMSRRALSKNRNLRIFPPSSRFLRVVVR